MRVCLILRADMFRPWPILRATREAELLRSQGKQVSVISWIKDESSKLPPHENKDGMDIRRVFLAPPKSFFLRFPAFLKVNRLLAERAIETGPDALLVHDLEVLRAGYLARKKLGVPLLYHAHEDWPSMVAERSRLEASIFSLLEKRYSRKVDRVYVPSEGIGEKYRRWGVAVTVQYASKSLASLPKVTPEKRREIRGRYGFGEDDFVLGLAGSLGRAEALPDILAAMKQLPQQVKLLIVGGEEARVRAAKDMAESMGLSDRVRFTGILETIPYMEHVGILDVGLALFSGSTLNVIHVAPIKLFDYMAMGVPVIVSDLPAMRDIVERKCDCGIAVKGNDPAGIAKAVTRMRGDAEFRRRLSNSSREAFESSFSWEIQRKALQESHAVFR